MAVFWGAVDAEVSATSRVGGEVNMRKFVTAVCLTLAALAAGAPSAQAATTVQKDIPFSTVVEACGQTITLSGHLIGIFVETPLRNGGLLVSYHFQPQGVRGTSADGVVYHATGLTRETTVFVPPGGLTDTYINRFHIVGTAGSPTYVVSETLHITITADGTVRVNLYRITDECV
jgi:hypothetical protein